VEPACAIKDCVIPKNITTAPTAPNIFFM
jgi:hypothetical protein